MKLSTIFRLHAEQVHKQFKGRWWDSLKVIAKNNSQFHKSYSFADRYFDYLYTSPNYDQPDGGVLLSLFLSEIARSEGD